MSRKNANQVAGSAFAVISGGYNNFISVGATGAVISGGYYNSAYGFQSTVVGGGKNSAGNGYFIYKTYKFYGHTTVCGGLRNTASGHASTISGGLFNTASGSVVVIGGGQLNTASGDSSTICGGSENYISGGTASNGSTINGGRKNTASGKFSVVCGGALNTASGNYSWAGGKAALAGADGSFVWGGTAGASASTVNSVVFTGINGQSVSGGIPVLISPDTNQLGTGVSSIRYKENIQSIVHELPDTLEALMSLNPVKFNYKNDMTKCVEYGLIAEEVVDHMPEIVVYNNKGEIETIRYHLLSPLMLAELIKLKADHKEEMANLQEQILDLRKELAELRNYK